MRRSLLSCAVLVMLAPAAHGAELDGAFLRGSSNYEPAYPEAAVPEPAAWSPAAPSEYKFELGARVWVSTRGSFAKNLYDDPRSSNNLNSRLTYSGLSGRSTEGFFRLDHISGFFLKGIGGFGAITEGTLHDEDFPPAIQPYSNTISNQQGGRLGYYTVDFGYDVLTAPNYRIGAFVGYNYMSDTISAFGCTQTAGNPDVCVPTLPASLIVITESPKWNSFRLGIAADMLICDRLHLNLDAAWLPYTMLSSVDNHWLRSDLIGGANEGATGTGVQVEASASYQFTDAWSAGLGARYWRMQANGRSDLEATSILGLLNVAVPQPTSFTTDRFGVFAQGSYKFGFN
jgi:outer membrane protease